MIPGAAAFSHRVRATAPNCLGGIPQTQSYLLIAFFCWGPKCCVQYSIYGIMSSQERGMIPLLIKIAMSLFGQSRMLLASLLPRYSGGPQSACYLTHPVSYIQKNCTSDNLLLLYEVYSFPVV